MRTEGVVTEWNDERGFGFVVPDDGSQWVFFHISAVPRGRRPRNGNRISYLTATDERGRPQAADARLLGRSRRNRAALTAALVVAGVVLVALVVLVATGALSVWVLVAQLLLSVVSFSLYRVDKAAAERRKRRIPEAALHLVDLFGGWPGALVARPLFRHKTTKQPFRTVFWLTVAVNVVALVLLVTLTG